MTNDPFDFDDDDRTVLRPGGQTTPSAGHSPTHGNQPRQALRSLPPLGGINKLEKAASRLLPLLLTIRNTTSHSNPEQLRNRLIQELNQFKQSALPILRDPKKVTQASYVMCTVLDEAAMNTPWGHQTNWAQHNLLVTFHNEVVGGKTFFSLLKGLGKNPKENIDLLELIYVCLSLGYEGAYRIAQNGQNTLAKVRVWLYDIITSVRSTPEPALSIQWQGSGVQESKLPKLTVFWVVGAAALALSSLVFIGYRHSLGSRFDEAIASLISIKAAPLEVNSIAPPAAPLTNSSDAIEEISLQQLLQPQIDLGLVEVKNLFDEGKVRILSNNLFASGNTELNPDLEPLVIAIAQALDQFNGSILIRGYTDNLPISSGRFPSNLELSQARTASVAERIRAAVKVPSRVTAEGRGSSNPIADNSNANGRARNRRVEVSIFY